MYMYMYMYCTYILLSLCALYIHTISKPICRAARIRTRAKRHHIVSGSSIPLSSVLDPLTTCRFPVPFCRTEGVVVLAQNASARGITAVTGVRM